MIFRNKFRYFLNYKRAYSSASKRTFFVEKLRTRSLLKVSGDEVIPFLQGLITNDMKHLTEGALSMYAHFLNSKGRILYDTIIYNTPNANTFFVECDSEALTSLKKHLTVYKVRRKINIDNLEDFNVWAIFDKNIIDESINKLEDIKYDVQEVAGIVKPDVIICRDPRIPILGLRAVAPKETDIINELKQKNRTEKLEVQENIYKIYRYKLGIPEGNAELPPGSSFPLEANCDFMHGVSFHKGCYLGQEVTARTHHTGVVRKRYMPVFFNEDVKLSEQDTPILPSGSDKSIGKLRGVEKSVGIALLRIQEALQAPELKINDKIIKTVRPFWWPTEAPKERPKLA